MGQISEVSKSDEEFNHTVQEAEKILKNSKISLKDFDRTVDRLRIKLADSGTKAEELLLQDKNTNGAKKELREEYSIKKELVEAQRKIKKLESSIEEIEDILNTQSREEKIDKYNDYVSRLEDDFRIEKEEDLEGVWDESDSSFDDDEEEEEEEEDDKEKGKNMENMIKEIQKLQDLYIKVRIRMIKKRSSHSSSVKEAWDLVHEQNISKSPGSNEMVQYWDDLLD